MIQVLEIKGDDTALVSTVGLFRVLVDLRPIGELLDRSTADAVAGVYDQTNPGRHAVVWSYADAAQSSSSFCDN